MADDVFSERDPADIIREAERNGIPPDEIAHRSRLASALRVDAGRKGLASAEISEVTGVPHASVVMMFSADGDVLLGDLLRVLTILNRDLAWLQKKGVIPLLPKG